MVERKTFETAPMLPPLLTTRGDQRTKLAFKVYSRPIVPAKPKPVKKTKTTSLDIKPVSICSEEERAARRNSSREQLETYFTQKSENRKLDWRIQSLNRDLKPMAMVKSSLFKK